MSSIQAIYLLKNATKTSNHQVKQTLFAAKSAQKESPAETPVSRPGSNATRLLVAPATLDNKMCKCEVIQTRVTISVEMRSCDTVGATHLRFWLLWGRLGWFGMNLRSSRRYEFANFHGKSRIFTNCHRAFKSPGRHFCAGQQAYISPTPLLRSLRSQGTLAQPLGGFAHSSRPVRTLLTGHRIFWRGPLPRIPHSVENGLRPFFFARRS